MASFVFCDSMSRMYENHTMTIGLVREGRIRTRQVERVFRVVNRGDYVSPEDKYQAYRQQPWRRGLLHLSAPSIYGEVLELLTLRPGLSFLNIGSGTGYLNTLVGLLIGCTGVNHGVEVHQSVVDYSNNRLEHFIGHSPALYEYDFCAPKFYCGNGLCLGPFQKPYDRIYCGAQCPPEYLNYLKKLLKIDGILVLPVENRLLLIKRKSIDSWSTRSMLHVAFTTLKLPTKEETESRLTLEVPCPQRLQILSYAVVRNCMRASQISRFPRVFEPLLRCPRLTYDDMNKLLRRVLNSEQKRQKMEWLSRYGQQNGHDENGNFQRSSIDPCGIGQPEDLHRNNIVELTATSNQSDESDQSDRSDQSDQSDRSDQSDKSDRSDQSARSDRSDRSDQLDKSDQSDRSDQSSRSVQTGSSHHPKSTEASEGSDKANEVQKKTFKQLSPPNFPLFILTTTQSEDKTSKSGLTLLGAGDASNVKDKSTDSTDKSKEVLTNKPIFGNIQAFPPFSVAATQSEDKTNKSGLTLLGVGDASNDKDKSTDSTDKSKEVLKNQFFFGSNKASPSNFSPFSVAATQSEDKTNKSGLTLLGAGDASNDKENSTDSADIIKGSDKSKEVLTNQFFFGNNKASPSNFPPFSVAATQSEDKTNISGLTLLGAGDASNDKDKSTDSTDKSKEVLTNKPIFGNIQASPSVFSLFSVPATQSEDNTNKSGLPLPGTGNASNDKDKSTDSTDKSKEVLTNKPIFGNIQASPSVFSLFSVPATQSEDKTNKSGLTLLGASDASNDKDKSNDSTNKSKEVLTNKPIFDNIPRKWQFGNPVNYPQFRVPATQSGDKTNKSGLTLLGAGDASNDENKSNDTTNKSKEVLTNKSIFDNMPRQWQFGNPPNYPQFSFPATQATLLDAVSKEEKTAEAGCLNRPQDESIGGVIESASTQLRRATEYAPVDELNSPRGQDIRILVKPDATEIQLPHQHNEFNNMVRKTVTAVEDKSSWKICIGEGNGHVQSKHIDKLCVSSRSKIALATALSSAPLAREVPPATVTVSFKTLFDYTNRIWDVMQTIGTRQFNELDTAYNKAVFQKGALLLAEAKVAYAQRTSFATLPNQKAFHDEELRKFNGLATKMPLSLAIYLDCLGNTNYLDQVITPIFPKNSFDFLPNCAYLEGALAMVPHQMVSLFELLRNGVVLNGALHKQVLELSLPMVSWEGFTSTEGEEAVRITNESHNFWVTLRNGSSVIKWDDDDHRRFEGIMRSLESKEGFIVKDDLAHGNGSLAQVVGTIDYKVDSSMQWYTMIPVDDDSIKLGAAFAFNCCKSETRFAGSFVHAYSRGLITPRTIMSAIISHVWRNT